MKSGAGKNRYWVSVYFRCCNVYQRVYFAHDAQEASGRCPKCLRETRFRLSRDAPSGRFFNAED